MPNLTASDMASRTMRKGWVDRNDTSDETQDAAEAAASTNRRGVTRKSSKGDREDTADDVGVSEKVSRAMNSGRDLPSRFLYNATRGDTVGEAIMGKQASEKKLKRDMKRDASDAEYVDRAVPRKRSPLYDKDEED